jgi:hypothetical protein
MELHAKKPRAAAFPAPGQGQRNDGPGTGPSGFMRCRIAGAKLHLLKTKGVCVEGSNRWYQDLGLDASFLQPDATIQAVESLYFRKAWKR